MALSLVHPHFVSRVYLRSAYFHSLPKMGEALAQQYFGETLARSNLLGDADSGWPFTAEETFERTNLAASTSNRLLA